LLWPMGLLFTWHRAVRACSRRDWSRLDTKRGGRRVARNEQVPSSRRRYDWGKNLVSLDIVAHHICIKGYRTMFSFLGITGWSSAPSPRGRTRAVRAFAQELCALPSVPVTRYVIISRPPGRVKMCAVPCPSRPCVPLSHIAFSLPFVCSSAIISRAGAIRLRL
jgi:hypothetical protein